MSLRPDDPKLSAWLLGELSPDEAAEVERAVAADPALRLAAQQMDRVHRLLASVLAPRQDMLFPRQRNSVLREARRMDATSRAVAMPVRRDRPVAWIFPIAAAAVVALACWLLVLLPGGEGGRMADGGGVRQNAGKPEIGRVSPPAPSPVDAGRSEGVQPATQSIEAHPRFPVLIPRSVANTEENPVLPLPVQAGRKSLDWVKEAVRTEKRFPHPHAVRVEEILNRFSLRPGATAELAKGVALSAECVPCPWSPSSELLIVCLRGASTVTRQVTAEFHMDPAVVRSYRLLGYARVAGGRDNPLPTALAAGSSQVLVIEVQAEKSFSPFGSIDWTVDHEVAPKLEVVPRTDAKPSEDAGFAALVAACGLWLSDPTGRVDRDILSALIREYRPTAYGMEDRADFLRLMDEALALK